MRATVMFFVGKRKPHLTADSIVTTVSIITIYVVTVKMCMVLSLLGEIVIKCVLANEYILIF